MIMMFSFTNKTNLEDCTALGLTYEMQIRAVWKTVKTINPFCFNWETLTGQGSRLGDLGF